DESRRRWSSCRAACRRRDVRTSDKYPERLPDVCGSSKIEIRTDCIVVENVYCCCLDYVRGIPFLDSKDLSRSSEEASKAATRNHDILLQRAVAFNRRDAQDHRSTSSSIQRPYGSSSERSKSIIVA